MGEIVSLLDALAAKETEIGERLRALRKAHALSQEAAAHKVGASYRQWQRWEAGETEPRASNVAQISAAFEVSVAELVGPGPQSQLDRIEVAVSQLAAQLQDLRGETAATAAEVMQRLADISPPSAEPRQRRPA